MSSRTSLTLADLVVLSMLAERPMHGYEIWAELERREVARWASISKPQIYYSLKKLRQARHIEASEAADDAALGPDRQTFRPTTSGRRALADALARAEWATHDVPSPFVTWMVLSWQARPRDFAAQIARRRNSSSELEFYRDALQSIIEETSATSDAAMIVRLATRQTEVELAWLDEVAARHRPG